MKHLILSALALQLAFFSGAQTSTNDINKWSVGINVGAHDGHSPTYAFTRVYQIQHISANGRYMFNNRFGLMLDAGYDLFDFYNFGKNTNYTRVSLQAVGNLGNMLHFNNWTQHLGLLVHGGLGISSMWQKDRMTESPLFDKSDDFGNFIIGLRPQLKLGERVALNLDGSFIFHTGQDHTFGFSKPNDKSGFDAYFANISLGATFYLGKHAKHADWTPTVK